MRILKLFYSLTVKDGIMAHRCENIDSRSPKAHYPETGSRAHEKKTGAAAIR